MATTANRTITTSYTGDVVGTEANAAAANAASLGALTIQNLASGFNTITCPVGATLTGVTIVPPVGNTQTITLKGVTGDTGIALHKTDPTSLGLDSAVTSIGLTAGGTITGIRFFWT
jgi:hypothetical protein